MNVTLPGDGAIVETVDGASGAQRQVVHVANLLGTQPVSGSVAVSNLPATQAVTGTVAVSNFPGTGLTDTQLRAVPVPVSGTVGVSGSVPVTGAFFQATQPVSGTVSVSGTVTVSNPTSAGLTDAQLRASALAIQGIRRDAETAYAADLGAHPLLFNDGGRLKVSVTPADIAQTTGSIIAAAGTVVMQVKRLSNLSISMVATSLIGHNVSFEASNNSTNGADGNWYGVQVVRSNANTVETASGVLAATPAYMWQVNVSDYAWFRVRATAHTSGTAAYSLNPSAYVSEPIPAIQVSATQPISGAVTVTGTATNTPATPTASAVNSAATTNATLVKATAGTLFAIGASNTGAAAAFVKLYNKATAPTVGTDVPVLTLPIPPGSVLEFDMGALGYRFAAGIGLAITNLAADNDTTAVTAAQVKVLSSFI